MSKEVLWILSSHRWVRGAEDDIVLFIHMVVFYEMWKNDNEIQLTKNKIDLTNRKMKNLPPSREYYAVIYHIFLYYDIVCGGANISHIAACINCFADKVICTDNEELIPNVAQYRL